MDYAPMIDALKAMYAAGQLSSNIDGTQVTFDSEEGLLRRIRQLETWQAREEGKVRRPGAVPIRFG